jgi:hypothetical protein
MLPRDHFVSRFLYIIEMVKKIEKEQYQTVMAFHTSDINTESLLSKYCKSIRGLLDVYAQIERNNNP